MAVNTAFHTSNLHSIATERNLYSDLIKEAIQIYGHDVYYMDRTLVAEDTVWGEDSLSKYRTQHPIEMYMEDADGGFAGEKELMNQFGLQNLSEATFVVNKERFQELDRQIQIQDGTDTSSGGSILLEAGTIDQSSSSSTLTTVTGDNNFYILQDTAATDSDRPQEGDVIYHPVLDKMFQINFVDHDEPFYQLDNNPVYKMRCRLYDYSSEIIDTGISDIDAIESALLDLPPIDVLVNNAGGALGLDPAYEASLSDWLSMIDINVKGLVAVTHAILPKMVDVGCGHIVNIGSTAGNYVYPGGHVYNASKAFVKFFSGALRADLISKNVRVTNIEPANVETQFSLVRFKGDKEKADAVYDGYEPLKAEDVAESVYWAVSQPTHVNISRLEIMSTQQANGPMAIYRKDS